MANPLVSIVIPYFNFGDFIEDALISCLRQTYKPVQIIVINDGSTEKKSKEVFQAMKRKYQKNIFFVSQKNRGIASTRNRGISLAKGTLICCLDGDDKLHPQYLEKTVPLFKPDKKIGIVTTWQQCFGQDNLLMKTSRYDVPKLLSHDCLTEASVFQKKLWQQVGGYADGIDSYEDWDFWIRIISLGYRWEVVEEPLLFYRIRNNSIYRTHYKDHAYLARKIVQRNKTLYKKHISEVIGYLHEYHDMFTNTKGWRLLERFRYLKRVFRLDKYA